MPVYDRGGKVMRPMKIGRWMALRQTWMAPGQTMQTSVTGEVRCAVLREQRASPLHIHMSRYFTPRRWLESDTFDWVVDDPDSGVDFEDTTTDYEGAGADALGIGSDLAYKGQDTAWLNNYLRVHNEYFKWPGDSDASSMSATAYQYGLPMVNLSHVRSRLMPTSRDTVDDSYAAPVQGTVATIDLASLERANADFRMGQQQDWMNLDDRYMDFMKLVFDAKGTREIDKVPVDLGVMDSPVNGRDILAMDGANLGRRQGLMAFDIDHWFPPFEAPEHGIMLYAIGLRYAPIYPDEQNPFLHTGSMNWAEKMGYGSVLETMPPVGVREREILAGSAASNVRGYQPAGWQWRTGWNDISKVIRDRASFPYLMDGGTSASQWRDATRVFQAFGNLSLGDAFLDVTLNEPCSMAIPEAGRSVFAGGGN